MKTHLNRAGQILVTTEKTARVKKRQLSFKFKKILLDRNCRASAKIILKHQIKRENTFKSQFSEKKNRKFDIKLNGLGIFLFWVAKFQVTLKNKNLLDRYQRKVKKTI